MTEHDFLTAVSRTDFSERYYALCRRYPVRVSEPPPCGKSMVMRILSDLGREPRWDRRDKSYSFDRTVAQGALHIGFAIKTGNHVDFWFGVDRNGQRVGGNFAVIANRATILAGNSAPIPPYPRPESHGVDELRAIVAELFDLTGTLLTIVEQKEEIQ